jgi:hypothetical protein
MDKIITFIGWVGILIFILLVGGFLCVVVSASVYGQCGAVSQMSLRQLIPMVEAIEKGELATLGRVGDIEARLQSERPGWIELRKYHVVTRRVASGYDVVVEPTGFWRFCRCTYVLHDGGDRLETLPGYL